MSQQNWDEYFIGMAEYVATKSKDESVKLGAVIVAPNHAIISTGYNGFPRGVDESIASRHERPDKYLFTEHAERNAIFNATGPLRGCTMYMSRSPSCLCADCARAVIQVGIVAVIGPNRPFEGKGAQWEASLNAARIMMNEAGIATITIDDTHMNVNFGENTDAKIEA